MATTVILLVIILAGCRVVIPKLGDSVAGGIKEQDNAKQLSDCPDTPNCQGSQSSRAEQQVAPLSIEGDLKGAIQRIADVLSSQQRVKIVTQNDSYLHVTYTTRLMGYVDDVEFLLDKASSTVQIRSASRLGHSDLGANAKRIKSLRASLQGTL